MGGTSAVNGLATLRGLPEDYDGWAASWDLDRLGMGRCALTHSLPPKPMQRLWRFAAPWQRSGPLPVRRWRREEMGLAQRAFLDGMLETGVENGFRHQ